MKLIPISAGDFHCDGGALFGVIPKKLWSKVYRFTDENFTKLALRCLLVDWGERKMLIESGIGNFLSDKYLENNGYKTGEYLEESLDANGYSAAEITDVFFTHLHWDHCTGAFKWDGENFRPVFENAMYWCGKQHWEHAHNSNIREKAAFHSEVLNYLEKSGMLNLIETEGEILPGFDIRFYHGHTPGMAIPFIKYNGKTIIYTSDLVPTSANIPVLWIAAYDLFPVTVMEEKEKFMNEVADNGHILFFEHDYYTECATVSRSEKGFLLKERFNFNNIP